MKLPASQPYVRTWRAEKSEAASEHYDSANEVYFTAEQMQAYARSALESAAQLVEDYIRDYRGMAEVGDYFEALPGKIRGL